MFTEINKLHEMLTEANIPHTFGEFPVPTMGGYQIRMYADEGMTVELDDAICHCGSHGYHLGLLETYKLNDCNGFETAEQVFAGWKQIYAEANCSADTCNCSIIGADGEIWEGSMPSWD